MLRVQDERREREAGAAAQVGMDELVRLTAQEMLAVALEAERRAYLERHAAALEADGHRLVLGNGYHLAREIGTAARRCGRRGSTTGARGRASSRRCCRRTCAARPR
ncbi:MAG: hypothetical protein OXH19_00060 [Chloroflexi bacterium]|nr:hypothetical protein [Chloroflexota bacterium]MCY3587152.1 hypothetical protein [Chloroflexota bacterium]MCY3607790.1 hypothetical protein [Acidimicrobiaceae bacterium]MDE2708042.1 hypothetical protein [Chloroflexota bacterium]MXX48225.1 hypothetical protein [Chloroflexota bacterium]